MRGMSELLIGRFPHEAVAVAVVVVFDSMGLGGVTYIIHKSL